MCTLHRFREEANQKMKIRDFKYKFPVKRSIKSYLKKGKRQEEVLLVVLSIIITAHKAPDLSDLLHVKSYLKTDKETTLCANSCM